MLMESNFEFELFGRDAAMVECMVFVDEFHSDDGTRGIPRRSFADTMMY